MDKWVGGQPTVKEFSGFTEALPVLQYVVSLIGVIPEMKWYVPVFHVRLDLSAKYSLKLRDNPYVISIKLK